jgi:glycosyltransferase involved in cell wall biosynthesis
MSGGAANRIVVAIPTRDRLAFLRQSVASVLAQKCTPQIELLVVVDGSTDRTADWLDELDDPRLTVVRNEQPQGVSAARNRALERADGARWIAFLDDDDIWGPSHVQTLVHSAEHNRAGLVYSGAAWVDEARELVEVRRPRLRGDAQLALLRENIVGPPSGVLMAADALRSVGGFDDGFSLLADWDLWLRMSDTCQVASVPQITYAYTFHRHNMSRDVERLWSDVEQLDERRTAIAWRRGVSLRGQTGHSFRAWTYRQHERRLRAAYWYSRSFGQRRDPKELARAGAALVLGQRGMHYARRRLFRPRRGELSWLSPYRTNSAH